MHQEQDPRKAPRRSYFDEAVPVESGAALQQSEAAGDGKMQLASLSRCLVQ
jgi:hypothetical protein